MSFSFYLVSFLFVAVVGMLAFTKLKPIAIFGIVAGVLYSTNVLSLEQISMNYVNPSLVTLVILILFSAVLEKVGFVSELSRRTVRTRGNEGIGVFRLGFVAGFVSSFLNNTAVVATLMGSLSKQPGIYISRFLLPLSYASIAGGMMTMVGTSTNLIVNSFVEQAGLEPFGFFDFTWIGLPVFLVTLLILSIISYRFLPRRQKMSSALSRSEFLFERVILPDSSLIGRSIKQNQMRNLENIFLVEVLRDRHAHTPVSPDFILEAGDLLIFSGDPSSEHMLQSFDGLTSNFEQHRVEDAPLVEAVISPTSAMIGYSIKVAEFRTRFDAAVIAVRRGNKNIRGKLGEHVLQGGDTLLLAVGDHFYSTTHINRDFIAVSGVQKNKPLNNYTSSMVMLGFISVIGLAVAGVVPLLKGVFLLMATCLAFGLLTFEDIKERFPFEIIVVVGGALGLSQAMFDVGLASMLASGLEYAVGGLGPLTAMIGIYLTAWLVTELVTNNAAAALMFPIAYAMAEALGCSPYPFFMALAFASSASFLSPYGYQTNLMVFSAGNYNVQDYIKAGLPVLIGYSVVALALIPLVFPFYP